MYRQRRITRRQFLFSILYSIVLVALCMIIINSREHNRSNVLAVLTFLVNLTISIIMLVRAGMRSTYSFDMIFWLFGVFFFGVAPLLELYTGIYSWTLEPRDGEIIKTNLLILLWYICYLVGTHLKFKIRIRPKESYSYFSGDRKIITGHTFVISSLNFCLLVSILIAVYYLVTIGFTNSLYRSTNINESLDQAAGLLINFSFRYWVLYTLVLHIFAYKNGHKNLSRVIVVFVCLLISCFPTGVARNMMATVYGGLLMVCLSKYKNRRWITFMILGGLILLFPALSFFRSVKDFSMSGLTSSILESIQNTYLSPDYDSHQMFISVQRWVERDGITWGRQLLAALLFYIPRKIWTSKPMGTGDSAVIALRQGDVLNVCAPLVSEGYVNFGIAGIILFGVILGAIVQKVDFCYWHDDKPNSLISVVYPFLIFQFFFLLRGDMLSGTAYFVPVYVMGAVVYKICMKKRYYVAKEE